ncbi:MAG: hypothetical protein AAF702_01705 [Chloroflexota bacterium]
MQHLLESAISGNTIEGNISVSNSLTSDELRLIVKKWISNQGKHWPAKLDTDTLASSLKLYFLPYWVVSGKGSGQWSASIGVDQQVLKRCGTCSGRGRYTPIYSTDERRCDNCAGSGKALGHETHWSSQSGFVESCAKYIVHENFDEKEMNIKCGKRKLNADRFLVEQDQASKYNVITPLSIRRDSGQNTAKLATEDEVRSDAYSIARRMGYVRDLQVGYIQTSDLESEAWLYPMYLGHYKHGSEQLQIQLDGVTKKIWGEIPSEVKSLRRKDLIRITSIVIVAIAVIVAVLLMNDYYTTASHPSATNAVPKTETKPTVTEDVRNSEQRIQDSVTIATDALVKSGLVREGSEISIIDFEGFKRKAEGASPILGTGINIEEKYLVHFLLAVAHDDSMESKSIAEIKDIATQVFIAQVKETFSGEQREYSFPSPQNTDNTITLNTALYKDESIQYEEITELLIRYFDKNLNTFQIIQYGVDIETMTIVKNELENLSLLFYVADQTNRPWNKYRNAVLSKGLKYDPIIEDAYQLEREAKLNINEYYYKDRVYNIPELVHTAVAQLQEAIKAQKSVEPKVEVAVVQSETPTSPSNTPTPTGTPTPTSTQTPTITPTPTSTVDFSEAKSILARIATLDPNHPSTLLEIEKLLNSLADGIRYGGGPSMGTQPKIDAINQVYIDALEKTRNIEGASEMILKQRAKIDYNMGKMVVPLEFK